MVDAGGAGFLLLLDSALHVVDGEPLPEPEPTVDGPIGDQFDAVAHRSSGVDGELDVSEQRYEVMYFLDLADARIDDFKQGWGDDRRLDRRRRRRRPLELPRPHQRHRRRDRGRARRRRPAEADPRHRPVRGGRRRARPPHRGMAQPRARRDGHRRAQPRRCGLPPVTCAVVAVCSGDGLAELFSQPRRAGRRHRWPDAEPVDGRAARHRRARQRRPGRHPAQQQEHHPRRRAGRRARPPRRWSSCRPGRCPRRWPRSSSTTPRRRRADNARRDDRGRRVGRDRRGHPGGARHATARPVRSRRATGSASSAATASCRSRPTSSARRPALLDQLVDARPRARHGDHRRRRQPVRHRRHRGVAGRRSAPTCRSRCTTAGSRCTRTCSASSDTARVTAPITLRELAEIDVDRLRGVGERKRAALAAFGIETVLDLVTTYPRRWVDRTNEARIADLVPGDEALVLVTRPLGHQAADAQPAHDGDRQRRRRHRPHAGRVLQPAVARDGSSPRDCRSRCSARPRTYRGGLQMTNPIVDLIGDRTGRIVAIYPQSEKAQLTTWEIAGWVENALERCQPRASPIRCPTAVRRRLGLIGRGDALRSIHLPETMREKESARRRLAFDELLRVQLVLVMRKRALEHEAARHQPRHRRRARAALPRRPSVPADRRPAADDRRDRAPISPAPHPMHRLLQGDVGSGKTVVAVSTLLTAVQGGHQGALMAPTEVLAEQHATSVRSAARRRHRARPGQPVRRPAAAGRAAHQPRHRRRPARRCSAGLADGTVDIAIGTHALIQEGVAFHSLGVVVIDEQHRFGVEQRAALRDKASGRRARRARDDGHADPAHRGDDRLRRPRRERARRAATRPHADRARSWANGPLLEAAVWADVRERGGGRPAGVRRVPADRGEREARGGVGRGDLRAARRRRARGLRLGLLHGRLTPAEKEMTMDLFRAASSTCSSRRR